VKYFQQPCDQALQRIAATEYIGRYIQNGQFIFGTMGTISKPRY
jgi:hypothetical protein